MTTPLTWRSRTLLRLSVGAPPLLSVFSFRTSLGRALAVCPCGSFACLRSRVCALVSLCACVFSRVWSRVSVVPLSLCRTRVCVPNLRLRLRWSSVSWKCTAGLLRCLQHVAWRFVELF